MLRKRREMKEPPSDSSWTPSRPWRDSVSRGIKIMKCRHDEQYLSRMAAGILCRRCGQRFIDDMALNADRYNGHNERVQNRTMEKNERKNPEA